MKIKYVCKVMVQKFQPKFETYIFLGSHYVPSTAFDFHILLAALCEDSMVIDIYTIAKLFRYSFPEIVQNNYR